ncbi:Hypothetical predicted protein [Olea europaea subsp. europaea]|uniref:Uncharacterized protein n=1 Tax=Olea europaea subsp. europaea TaxID=158383 RepID=A0A8S0TRM5_OLEEU|nr:Hypothetical predicted protein [Olea europaea subsp. europaea]
MGLMCGPFPDEDAIDRVLQKKRLKEKYFKSIDRIIRAELEKAFLRSSTPRADQYKLDLALIIEGVFNDPDSHVGINIPTLLILDDQDIFFSYLWGRVSYKRLIRGFLGSLGRKFADAKQKKEKAVTYTDHGFPIAMQMQVYATLRPTKAGCGQPYISTLVSFEDCSVPALDNVARDSIAPQFYLELSDGGDNVGNEMGKIEKESNGGGSEDDEESGDGEDEVDGEETGGDESGDGNIEDSDDSDSGDSDAYVRQGATAGASLTRTEVEEMLLDQRTLIEIRFRTVKLEIIQHVTNEFVRLREFISTLVPLSGSRTTVPTAEAENESRVVGILPHDRNGDETDPDPECAEPQVHPRDFDLLLNNHDEDMGIEKQEGNGGCGMNLEPRMNGDYDAVASGGPGNRDDEPVASDSGVAEVDGK